MATGDMITSGVPSMPEAIPGMMGPTVAMRKALAAYLLAATFRVEGGDDPRDSVVQLARAYEHWPRPDERLEYPCVSIVEMAETSHDQPITPAPLEDTLGQFDSVIRATGTKQTCLWVTGDATTQFQVDFWCDRDPDRQAIEGALSNLFSPEEGRSAVVVEGPELYYSQPCEFALIATRFDDSSVFTERNERRLRCVIDASCAIVSLRRATLMKISKVIDVIDGVDPCDTGGI